MTDTIAATVAAAAARTLQGGARVRLTLRMAIPELDAEERYAGVVDFDRARARLELEDARGTEGELAEAVIIIDGATTYTSEPDGRWTYTEGAPGTYAVLYPGRLLRALVTGQTSATRTGEDRATVELDHDVLDAEVDGLAPEWRSTADVELADDGRVSRVALLHRDPDAPEARLDFDCVFLGAADVGPIEIPAPEASVSLEDRLGEERADGE
jgi:hypothetical protein